MTSDLHHLIRQIHLQPREFDTRHRQSSSSTSLSCSISKLPSYVELNATRSCDSNTMSFLRNKHGIDGDFSEHLMPEHFLLDDLTRFGFQGKVSTVFYDPIQSLLAVGTNETETHPGQIHIFGQARVHVSMSLHRKASVTFLRMYGTRVIVVDSKNELSLFDLLTGMRTTAYSPPAIVTVLLTDPALDWAFLGLQNGEVIVYDLDRMMLVPFRIPNLWREKSPKARLLPIVSLALHPRDLGTLLIGYLEGAIVFSFKQNKPTLTLLFELPLGAPGADIDPSMINTIRRPRLSTALWHPTGTFILTGYEDSCMVFWDPKDARILQSRTLQDTDIHLPGGQNPLFGDPGGTFSIRQPFVKIAWCCTANPDDTSLLIAGGNSVAMPANGLTLFDLGLSPSMVTSSYQVIAEHFASPKRQRVLPTPLTADVIDFCMIPRSSPYYQGNHDPLAIIAILSNGELVTLRYPDGSPLSPAGIMPPSVSLVQPMVKYVTVTPVDRERWLGLVESKDKPISFLNGGAEAQRPLKRFQNRNLVHTIHTNGTVRIWDIGHNDEIENPDTIELDVARVLNRHMDTNITQIAMSSMTGEYAVGLDSGEVLIYRWGRNKNYKKIALDDGTEPYGVTSASTPSGPMKNMSDNSDPKLKEGFLPLCLINENLGAIEVLTITDVGFIAIGYESGNVSLIDLRGPAIFFNVDLSTLSKEAKRSTFRKSISHSHHTTDVPLCMEFSVMSVEGDAYSSILLHVGTSTGHIATFKILPEGPRFTAQYIGSMALDEAPLNIIPIKTDNGRRALASQSAVSSLRQGQIINGALVAVTKTGSKIFRPATSKGTHKTWDDQICIAATVAELEDRGVSLLCLMSTGRVKGYTVPGLKEIGSVDMSAVIDRERIRETIIMGNGDVIYWSSPTEIGLGNVWGTGVKISERLNDILYNAASVIPVRPTISNFQWISGTQNITAHDFDLLIGGPDRPLSRKQVEEQRMQTAQQRQQASSAASGSSSGVGGGVFANMSKNLQQRTEALSLWSDNMEKLEESSANFAEAASNFVKQQKKKALLGGLKTMF